MQYPEGRWSTGEIQIRDAKRIRQLIGAGQLIRGGRIEDAVGPEPANQIGCMRSDEARAPSLR